MFLKNFSHQVLFNFLMHKKMNRKPLLRLVLSSYFVHCSADLNPGPETARCGDEYIGCVFSDMFQSNFRLVNLSPCWTVDANEYMFQRSVDGSGAGGSGAVSGPVQSYPARSSHGRSKVQS